MWLGRKENEEFEGKHNLALWTLIKTSLTLFMCILPLDYDRDFPPFFDRKRSDNSIIINKNNKKK